MFLLTHAYFCMYHALSSMAIRRALHAAQRWGRAAQLTAAGVVVLVLAYATAFMETLTISHVRLSPAHGCTAPCAAAWP